MATDIVIFKPTELDTQKTTKTEREILYENFEKNASIPSHHFQSFMEMENQDERIQEASSTIPSILIKSILPYCTPILKEIPQFTVKTKTVDIFKKKIPEKSNRDADTYYNIAVQLEYPIKCTIMANKIDKHKPNSKKLTDIVIPTHDTFNIVGINIPKHIVKNVDTSFLNYMNSLSPIDVLTSGKYGLYEFQSGQYTQSRISNISSQNTSKKYDTIYFTSDSDAKTKISMVVRYIKYVMDFYEHNLAMVYNYLYSLPITEHIKQQELLYNIINPEFYKQQPMNKRTDISKRLSKLIQVGLNNSKFANAFAFDNLNVYTIFNQINMLGDTNPFSKKLIQDLDKNQSYEKTITEFNKLKFKKKLEHAKKKAIAVNRFDISEIHLLTSNQRKVVDLEFNKLEKFYTDIKKHSADFDIVNKLIWAMDSDKSYIMKDTLAELEELVKIPKRLEDLEKMTSLLQNSTKVSLICPHVITKVTKMLEPTKNNLQKSGMLRDYLIKTFSLPATDDGHFCRICGELLAEVDEEEIAKYISGKRVSFVVEYDRLKSIIWKEVAYIMTVYVKFKYAVNHKNIITSITNTLRPEMGVIETNLAKIKSNSKDSIKDLMSIYIVTYTFAIVSHMIHTNYGKITFSFRPGVDKSNTTATGGSSALKSDIRVKVERSPLITYKRNKSGGKQMPNSKHLIQNIINNALFLILRMKSIAINEVASLTTESIKPILIKAYRWASTLKSDTASIRDPVPKDEVDLNSDNIYNYAKYIENVSQAYSGKTKPSSDDSPKTDKQFKHSMGSVKNILGRPWETIIKEFADNKSVYETMLIPKEWSDGESGKYKYGSYKFLAEYIKEKLYNKNAVPYSNELILHEKQYKYIQTLEDNLSNEYKRSVIRPFNNIPLQNNFMIKYNNFKPSNIKIDKYYDNSGKKHQFDIHVYQKANTKGVLAGPKKEYTKNDIVSWVNSGDSKKLTEFKQWFIVDARCSTCKVLLSQTKNSGIEQALQKLDNFKIFYEYYENRCPKGELHDFVLLPKANDNYCKKCNITNTMVTSLDKKYYEKYVSYFNKDQDKLLKLEKESVTDIIRSQKRKTVDTPKFSKWVINNAPILELSRTYKIKYNVWVNIGLIINKSFKLIESEKLNPSTSATKDMLQLRNLQLYNYYLQVVSMFYMVKNYDIIPNLPYNLKQIMSKNKVPNLKSKLMDMDTTVANKYEYYKNTSEPYLTSNFLLHTLSTTILNINKSLKSANVNVANDITLYIINNIIESEKMLSEPDLTKFATSVITAVESNDDGDGDGQDEGDDGIDVQDDYNSPEEPEKAFEELEDAEPDDEFATGDLDMEIDDDNMGSNPMDF